MFRAYLSIGQHTVWIPNFGKSLRRVVATFGFLEEMLARAIYALSGTRKHEQITDEMYKHWIRELQKALKEPLGGLIGLYEKELEEEVKGESELSKQMDLPQLIEYLRKVKVHRDVLCHGSWGPGSGDGKSKPFFVNKNDEVFEIKYGVADLRQVRVCVTEIICQCVNTVILKGIQFPGSNGPGKLIL